MSTLSLYQLKLYTKNPSKHVHLLRIYKGGKFSRNAKNRKASPRDAPVTGGGPAGLAV